MIIFYLIPIIIVLARKNKPAWLQKMTELKCERSALYSKIWKFNRRAAWISLALVILCCLNVLIGIVTAFTH